MQGQVTGGDGQRDSSAGQPLQEVEVPADNL